MKSLEYIDKVIKILPEYRNIEAQANARYILYGVGEDKENFPHFDVRLSEKVEFLAYLNLEVACTLFDSERTVDAVPYFEKGASLLEYNHAASREDYFSDFSLMISGLAYYCASQYSKSFIVISRGQYHTNFTEIIRFFLSKRFDLLENVIKESLLRNTEEEEWDNAFEILLARAMSLVICYFNYGNEEYLQKAQIIISDAEELAGMGEDPSIWWEFRLLHIIFSQIDKSSLWGCLHNNPSFKIDDGGLNEINKMHGITDIDSNKPAQDAVDKYIYSLSYKEKTITELFRSQRTALQKVLSNESSVVSMPTSSGKTRIAEMVMLQALLYQNTAKILYIAPYRSLAFELEETFSTSFSILNIGVSHLYGGAQFTSLDRAEMLDSRILIVTPEKAKAILRSNDEIVSSIKLVVLDEGHLLGRNDREIANEMFTEELRRIIKRNNGKFLVLSAVLPNAQDISMWVANKEDRVLINDWRPSDHRMGLLCYYPKRVDLEWQGNYECFNNTFVDHEGDKKIAVAKVAKKLSGLGSVLIYCPQNRSVMTNAKTMYSLIKNEPDIDWGDDLDWVKFALLCEESDEGKDYLKLAKKGVLCHGGALNQDIRRYMEKLLRKGKALYIYATNTLAQGVNLGVSTVIVMGLVQGRGRKLPKSDFWNMAGRAGRSFIDTEGKILFLCDCSDKEKWHREIAHTYIDQLEINDAVSGVYQGLSRICQIQKEMGINIDTFLQLITENNISELSSKDDDNQFISYFFELIDDSLLALDIANRDSDDDEVSWVDEHFRNSLAIIQQKNEQLRQEHIRIIKARVKAVRAITKGNNIPQSFASSGIPVRVALYLEDNMENIITLADEYFDSFQETDDMITFFKEFDSILDNVDSYRIKVPNSKVRDKEIENWLCGKNFVSKNSAEIRNYYSYTVSWVLNAIANRFNTEEDNKYKELFESMALIASYGVPSKWAVQIYLCGIHSRLSATELSQKLDDDNDFEKLWEVTLYLQNHADSILDDDQYSNLTKDWVNVLVKEDRSNFTIVPKFNNFKFARKKKDVPDLLFCKRYNDRTYLCSEDYKFKVRVKDTKTLHFSDVADIPGIYFLKKNDVWKMHNVNPYIEIK